MASVASSSSAASMCRLRNRFRLRLEFERVAQVDNDNVLARVDFPFKLLGRNSGDPQVAQELAVIEFPENIARETRQHEHQKPFSQRGRVRRDSFEFAAEHIAGTV